MRARQQKPPETRRADILRAAEKLFLANGIGQTRIEDIAKAADMGKGTLYLYFKSKDDILVGLGQMFLNYFVERIAHHLQQCQGDDLNHQLEAWLNGCLDAFYDKADLHHLVFHLSSHKPVENKHANPAVKAAQDILETHKQDDSAFRAAILFNMVHGGMEFAFSQSPTLPKHALLTKLIVAIKNTL